jgi:hypothetical protein
MYTPEKLPVTKDDIKALVDNIPDHLLHILWIQARRLVPNKNSLSLSEWIENLKDFPDDFMEDYDTNRCPQCNRRLY